MKKLLLISLICLSLVSCGKEAVCGDCSGGEATLYPNMDICDMRALYNGSPSGVNRNVIVAGRVTANDISGNFYRSFVIEDATGAVEVRAGLYDLKNIFPEGRYVAVKANGLTLSEYNGILQIGLAPSGGYHQADYFGHRAVMDKYVVRGKLEKKVVPLAITIDQLDDDMCGRLVSIKGLALKDGEPRTWASTDEFTSYSNRAFKDAGGWEINVSTSKYASFAANTIPQGRVELTGILIKDTHYALRLRTLEDVAQD